MKLPTIGSFGKEDAKYMETMDASKEIMDSLIKNVSLAMEAMFTTIKADIAVLKGINEDVSTLLAYAVELRMDVKFVLLNLESSFYALISSSRVVEKRFHIQNLYADMQGSYKLLYGFGKMRPHTVWARIGTELKRLQTDNTDELYSALFQTHGTITDMLLAIEPSNQDKKDRDFAYHYDDELLNVYNRILRANDEDGVSKRVIDFLNVSQNLLLYSDLLEKVEAAKGYHSPKVPLQKSFLLPLQKMFAEQLSEHTELRKALDMILDNADRVDQAAKMRQGIMNIKSFALGMNPTFSFPEADNMDYLTNAQLLLQYMLLEGATTTNAYLKAGSAPAFPLILRRLTMTRVSVLVHLYGYNDKEHDKALWPFVVGVIPSTAVELQAEAKAIEECLEVLIDEEDKDERALCAHLIDNSSYKSNVPTIIAKIEGLNPMAELQKMDRLLQTISRVQKFLMALMDCLADEAHKRVEASTAKMLAQIQAIRDGAKSAKCSDEVRALVNAQMDSLEKLVKDPLSVLRKKE